MKKLLLIALLATSTAATASEKVSREIQITVLEENKIYFFIVFACILIIALGVIVISSQIGKLQKTLDSIKKTLDSIIY